MARRLGRRSAAEVTTASYGGEVDGQVPTARSWRRPRPVHVLLAAGLVLALAAGAVLLSGKLLISRYAGSVHQANLLGGASAAPHDRAGAAVNLLLVGSDEQSDPGSGARSDSIIIVHVPANHERAYLVSIPRDSRVDIPAYTKTGYSGGTDKINAAFAYGFTNNGGMSGGFELLALTIRQLTGISFNAGAIVNFDGLRKVVDAVGGVDMCVDEATAQARAGCQHFDGAQALTYARERYSIPDGDYGRQRHQQQLITAIAKKVASVGMLTDPLATDRAVRSAGNAVTFDGNGTSLVDWVLALRKIDPGAIAMVKTNGGRYTTQVIGGQDFEILTDTSRQLFAAVRDDTVDAFVAAHPDWVNGNRTR